MAARLERRHVVGPWHHVVVPLASVLAALAVGAAFLLLAGHDPVLVYREMLRAAFTTRFGIEDTLVSATPLILTGLAAAVAFRFKLYNIGAEGQLYLGAIVASGIVLAVGTRVPAPVAVALVILGGAAGGMLWMAVPALSRAWLGTSEIITTLLFNYVALYLLQYLIFGSRSPWRDATVTNFPQGRRLPEAALLPQWGTSRISLGLAIGVAAALAVWVLLARTRFGFQLRVFGDSPAAARYAGIPVRRTTVTVLLLSGALAGLAGASEVAGRTGMLDPNGLAVGFGYTGIIVAALARYNPVAVPGVALLIGGLQNAGTALQSLPGARVPVAISTMLQGAILLFVLAGELSLHYRVRWRRPRAAQPPAGTGPHAPAAAAGTTGATGSRP